MEKRADGIRVFISYGHRDAALVAERIRESLSGDRYLVWKDSDGIRVGQGWSEEVRDALRESHVLVALLTPNAVRRARDLANPDRKDSVCLDEIAYAVDGCLMPVVPVMVTTCEPPFRIFRLQFLDFRTWHESKARYAQLITSLKRSIDEVVLTHSSRLRDFSALPEPWDFGPFLADRRKGFVGREWLLRELEAWRDSNAPSMLITGLPGVGKSAIVAQLVHENPDGQVLAYHCCMADTPATLAPDVFVRSLAGQLAARLEGFAAAIRSAPVQERLNPGKAAEDPFSAFEVGVLAPLAALPQQGTRYLLIDALDESLARAEGQPTIIDLLATRLRRFPSWLRILATTRPELPVLRRFGALVTSTLEVSDERNWSDVRRFAETRIARLPGAEQMRTERLARMVRDISTAAAGNFLVATLLVEAIESGQLTSDDVAKLPPTLPSLYETFFDRLYALAGPDYRPLQAVLEVVLAAQEPPTSDTIAAVLRLERDEVVLPTLALLRSFVPHRQGAYSIFHRSLGEWLTGRMDDSDQPLAGRYHVDVRRGHERWCDHWLAAYRAGDLQPPLVRSLATHLMGAQRWDDIADVIVAPRFLVARSRGPARNIASLLADCATAVSRMPHEHPRYGLVDDLHDALVRQSPNLHRSDLSPIDQLILEAEICATRLLKDALQEGRDGVDGFSLLWTTYVHDPAYRRPWNLSDGYTHSLSMDADGKVAVSGDDEGNVVVLNLDTGEATHRFPSGAGRTAACAISGDGTRLVHSGDDAMVVLELPSAKVLLELPQPESIREVAMSYSGQHFAACVIGAPFVWIVDVAQGTRRAIEYPGVESTWCCAFAAEVPKLLTAHTDGTLLLWDLASLGQLQKVKVEAAHYVACSLDWTARRALAAAMDGVVAVWDITNGTARTMRHPFLPEQMTGAVCANRGLALFGGTEGQLTACGLDPGRPPRVLYGNTKNDMWSVAIDGEGRRGLSVTKGGNAVEWNLERAVLPHVPRGMGAWIEACAISGDGTRIAALGDQRLMAWDLRSGQPVLEASVGGGFNKQLLRLNHDGTRACFLQLDRIRYWNLERNLELFEPDDACPLYGSDEVFDLSVEGTHEMHLLTRSEIASHLGQEEFDRRFGGITDASGRLMLTFLQGCVVATAVDAPERIWEVPHSGQSVKYCAHVDGDELLVVTDDGTVLSWELRSVRRRAAVCVGNITCATCTADGRLVLLANGSGDLFVLTRGASPEL